MNDEVWFPCLLLGFLFALVCFSQCDTNVDTAREAIAWGERVCTEHGGVRSVEFSELFSNAVEAECKNGVDVSGRLEAKP